MDKGHRTWKFIGIALLVVIVGASLFIFLNYVGVLIAALAMAYISYPIARFLVRGDTRPGWRFLLASFASVLLIIIPLLLSLFYALDYSLKWLIQNLPAIESGRFIADLKTTLTALGLGVLSERIASEVGKLIGSFATRLSTAVLNPTWVIGLFVKIVLFFIAAFYFVYEGPQFKRFIDTHVTKRDQFLKEILYSFNKICYSLFVSHFFTSIIVTAIAAIGFWIILRPTLIFLGILSILIFVVAFLPVIGPWLLYVPLALWQIALVPGGYTRGLAIFVFGVLFLTLIPDLYIRPKLVARGSEIHPLLFIIGFFGGEVLFGLKGVILGPLLLGLAQGIVTLYVKKRHILKELIEHF